MFFAVGKNHFSGKKGRRRRVAGVLTFHPKQQQLHVFSLFVLISSSLITLVICSTSKSHDIIATSNTSSERRIRSILSNNENRNDIVKIRVLHTNDLHSRFDEVTISGSKCKDKDRKSRTCYGGVARIKHMVDDIRKQHSKDNNDNVLFLNAGDFFQGTVWYSMFKWKVVANLTKDLGYTASSLGNHEFDDGDMDLERFTQLVPYPMLACNLDLSQQPTLKDLIKPSITQEITYNGKTRVVGIIGYVTPDTKDLSNAGKNVVFLNEIQPLQAEVQKMKNNGVDIIIALGHSGYKQDLDIAKKVEGIDLIVGGHTNTFLWNGDVPKNLKFKPVGKYPTVVTSESGKQVLVVQTNGYGRYLGDIEISFDSNGDVIGWSNEPILMKNSIPMDKNLRTLVENYRKQVMGKMDTKIGHTNTFLDGGRPQVRLRECPFGNFLADAMAQEMKVNIAFVNSGSIKGSFAKGDVTLEDVYRTLPWPSTIDVVNVSGATLQSIMEHSVRDYVPNHEDPGGKFLQIAGLIVHYNISKPKGERVVSLKVGRPNESLNLLPSVADNQVYSVALPSYLVGGGDGYKMIPQNLIDHKNTGFLMQDLVAQFVKNNSPINMPLLGRISFVTHNKPIFSTSTLDEVSSTTTSSGHKVEYDITTTFHFFIADIVLFITCRILS